jgi:hypothetical protein
MANRYSIPAEVESRLRRKFTTCAYCRQPMREHADVKGCPGDKATIEHLNRRGPVLWGLGLREEHLVICCGSCNSNRSDNRLVDWFQSRYCERKGITEATVADEVKQYLGTRAADE